MQGVWNISILKTISQLYKTPRFQKAFITFTFTLAIYVSQEFQELDLSDNEKLTYPRDAVFLQYKNFIFFNIKILHLQLSYFQLVIFLKQN